MKILYCCGKLPASNLRCSEFLKCTEHEVKIAAYYSNHEYLDTIHWCLDALETNDSKSKKQINKLLGKKIALDLNNLQIFLDDIVKFSPDLIISDYEFCAELISEVLDIALISCSPMHMIDGINYKFGTAPWFKNKDSNVLNVFNTAKKKYVYSWLANVENKPELKSGFEYIRPYCVQQIFKPRDTELIQRFIMDKGFAFNTGNSENIAHQLTMDLVLCAAHDPADMEAVINAYFIQELGIGIELGKCESSPQYLLNKLNSELNFNTINVTNNAKFLHQAINDI